MSTQEIPRSNWSEFCHGFSSAHQGWFATIEVFGSDIGAQIEARELPFVGITADPAKRAKGTIALMLGRKPGEHLTHTITAVTHLRLDQAAEGENEALQIESTGDATTLVRFRPPAIRPGPRRTSRK